VTHTCVWEAKAVPQHTYVGDWVEKMYRSYSSWTSALDGDEWSASRPRHALAPGKGLRYPLYRRLGIWEAPGSNLVMFT